MPLQPAARSRLVGVGLGVLLLLAMVLLVVGLPRLQGSGASASGGASGEGEAAEAAEAGGEIALPTSVDGFAVPSSDDAAAGEELDERLGSAETELEEIYGVPASIEFYTDAGDGGAQRTAAVTALAAPAGLFLPSGPAPDPELLNLARNQTELVRVGEDAVCNLNYGAPVPAGGEVDPEAVPAAVQCQLTSGGVTYQVDGSAMAAEEAVGLLGAVAEATEAP